MGADRQATNKTTNKIMNRIKVTTKEKNMANFSNASQRTSDLFIDVLLSAVSVPNYNRQSAICQLETGGAGHGSGQSPREVEKPPRKLAVCLAKRRISMKEKRERVVGMVAQSGLDRFDKPQYLCYHNLEARMRMPSAN
jgi:hypothetical protein